MRAITEDEKRELLDIKVEDMDFNKLLYLIGHVNDKKPKFEPNDTFTLKAKEYINTKEVKTTVGRFIYNKYLLESGLHKYTDYVNETINKGVQDRISNTLCRQILNDKLSTDEFANYLNRLEFLAKKLSEVICGSFTKNTIVPLKSVIKERDKLLKENREDIEKGNIFKVVEIENKLQEIAKEELKGDPGMELYDSGARGSFGNNYTNNSIMRGGVFNPSTGQWEVVEQSFMEGLDKKDLAPMGNAVVTGAYPKAVGTGVAGYYSKQIIASLQAVTLDKRYSDCKTKKTIAIKVTNHNHKMFDGRFIKEGNTFKELTIDNIKSYIGKTIQLRSILYNTTEKVCNRCAGELYYKRETEAIGLTAAAIATAILNLNMKAFHDTSIKVHDIDITDLTI